ncbi:hypothetical protein NC652_016155 [Populus alba x Populus x berolinensis]|nr:hypothetical protein NC652_016155 [Populus alba x Populus x berolinensis]
MILRQLLGSCKSTVGVLFYLFEPTGLDSLNNVRVCTKSKGLLSSCELEGTNPPWRVLELTNLTRITMKKERKRCPTSTVELRPLLWTSVWCDCDHVGWGAGDIILTAVMALSQVIFIIGRPFYRYQVPTGSPLTPMLQVLVAAIRNRNLPYPSNPAELYEVPKSRTGKGRLLCHTESLKFLDKATIVKDRETGAENQNPWRLATVTKVEEMKLILNLIPIWLAMLPFGVSVAQTATFFIKQGTTSLQPRFTHFAAIGMIVSVTIYEKILVPVLRRATGNERGIKILQRIGVGMLFSIATMVVSALVERKRLGVVAKDPVKGSLSMSVFWLAPQFVIIGVGDAFTLVGLQEYFYDQVPDSMRSLGIAFTLVSLLITAVDHVTEKTGKSWFGKDLNSSRLDNFYWLVAAMTAANFILYVFLARRYPYKNVQSSVAVADCYEDGLEGSMA